MSRVGGKIRVGRVTPIQQFFFFGPIGVNKDLGRMRRNLFTQIKPGHWGKFLFEGRKGTPKQNPFPGKRELHVKGSAYNFEEIIWQIIKLRAYDCSRKPEGASAWVWGTGMWLSSYLLFYIWALKRYLLVDYPTKSQFQEN